MDECTLVEVNDIVDCIPYTDRPMWESQRLLAYITAQGNSRKKLKMDDICTFKWEEKEEIHDHDHETSISNEDIDRLKKIAQQWEK